MHSSNFAYRVAVDRGASFELLQADGITVRATYRGDAEMRPAVGDYVDVDATKSRVCGIAPRESWIARAGPEGQAQIVAANVTTGFIVTSPEAREFSPARVVRYLIALRSGKVEPVILLNKSDIASSDDCIIALREIADGAVVLPVSATTGVNCEALEAYLQNGTTVALCGSSGVGKSTLLNRLAGDALMHTEAMREDGRGRHTTTFRQLIVLKNGAALVDTPGMRSFAPIAERQDIDATFGDIAQLAEECRFRDCRHEHEPGCSVRERARPERLEQWRKLEREAAWLETRSNVVAAIQRKEAWKRIHKTARANPKKR